MQIVNGFEICKTKAEYHKKICNTVTPKKT